MMRSMTRACFREKIVSVILAQEEILKGREPPRVELMVYQRALLVVVIQMIFDFIESFDSHVGHFIHKMLVS